jgi:hypothetical protein
MSVAVQKILCVDLLSVTTQTSVFVGVDQQDVAMSREGKKGGERGNSSQDGDAHEEEDDEFNYALWQTELRLTEDGAKKLEKTTLQDEGTIMCVTEVDIAAMKLQIGDQTD